MHRLGRAFVIIGAVAILGGVLYWAFRPKPALVEIGTVTEGPLQAVVEEDGRTRVRDKYVVSAPLSGRVLRLSVKAGDQVRTGGPVATLLPSLPPLLDPRTRRELEERVGAAEAGMQEATVRMERAETQAAQVRADVQRIRTLHQKGVASVQQLEREELSLRLAERDVQAAEMRMHASRHEVDQASALLRKYDEPNPGERWEVTAPVDGRVLRVAQESEAFVSAGAPLVEIGDPGDLEVIVDVLTTDAVGISPGAPVSIERWGGPTGLQGKVRLVEPAAFTKVSALGVEEQRVWVLVDITSPREAWTALGDAYRVDTMIVIEDIPKAILIPISALFRRGQGWFCFAVEDGTARERAVAVTRRSGLWAAISQGVRAGDTIVLYPPSTLSDGAAIRAR